MTEHIIHANIRARITISVVFFLKLYLINFRNLVMEAQDSLQSASDTDANPQRERHVHVQCESAFIQLGSRIYARPGVRSYFT